jgi:hypothetical protein
VKIQPIEDWAEARSAKNVLKFLGFANFYRRFSDGPSKAERPLTKLTAFNWAEATRSALATSKHLLPWRLFWCVSTQKRPMVIDTDATVLSQIEEAKWLHPVAYHSRKFKPAETNYYVCYNETFKEWVHMPKAVAGEITVYTNHQNCSNFATTKVSTRRQAPWSEHLAEFNFKVIYRPGEKNTKKDVLSRRWDNALKEGSEASPVSFSRPFPAQFPESKRIRRETSSKAQRLRQTRLPSQRTGYSRIPPMELWF